MMNNVPTQYRKSWQILGGIGLCLVVISILTTLPVHAQNGFPKPTDSYINDYANLLTGEDAAQVRALLTDLNLQYGIKAIVVTIGSINDYPTNQPTIEAFATNLFNTWGIGNRDRNNGVLLLVAVNDRKVRVELGSGYERGYNDEMQEVINEHILPSFRQSNYSQGIYRGVRAIVGQLTGTWPPDVSSRGAGDSQNDSSNAPSLSLTTSAPGGMSSEVFYGGLAIALGGGALSLGAGAFGLQRYRRFRPRTCPACQTRMVRLDEVSDDVYLDSGQKIEEMLDSVDYDVWKCATCNTHILESYRKWFSGLKKCPQCNYRTVKVSSETLDYATYTSTGSERITRDCQHCTYHDTKIVILPMKTHSTDSSSSFSSGSSSSDSSGGGSSSGGGASGSW